MVDGGMDPPGRSEGRCGEDTPDNPGTRPPGPGGDNTATTSKPEKEFERVFQNGQTWVKCLPCNKLLNTMEQFLVHQKSPKHKKARDSGVHSSSTLAMGNDATNWHTCPVCNKRVNSRDQLEKHLKSHKTRSSGDLSSDSGSGSPEHKKLKDDDVGSDCGFATPAPGQETDRTDNSQAQLNRLCRSDSGTKTPPAYGQSPWRRLEGAIDDIEVIRAGTPIRKNPAASAMEEGGEIKQKTTVKHPQTTGGVAAEDKSPGLRPVGQSDAAVSTIVVPEPPGPGASEDSLVSDSMATEDSPNLVDQMAALELDEDDEQPTTPEEDPIRGKCAFEPCFWHCGVCDMHLGGPEPKQNHIDGSKHLKNLKKRGLLVTALTTGHLVPDGLVAIPTKEKSQNTPEGYYDYCDLCKVPFSGPEALASHLCGKQHRAQAAKKGGETPRRQLPDIKQHLRVDDTDILVLTKTEPRSYQVELYKKAMAADSVIFLPTGTGKTLVGVMVIAKMLKENPARPVVFLVDRVLLVLQQSDVIRKQLHGTMFNRYDYQKRDYVRRSLKIAALCGEQQNMEDASSVPLWQHDVIVVTAAYYENLIENKAVYWKDNCLVVFDEAHHCTKDHPFNVLLRDYHLPLSPQCRPKVLGLTASPAGKSSLPQTQEMLNTLLRNMGDVHVQIAEEEAKQLERFRSSAKISIEELRRHPGEDALIQGLVGNMEAACQALLHDPEIKHIGGVVPRTLQEIENNAKLFGDNVIEASDKLQDIIEENGDQLKSAAERFGGNVLSLWNHLSSIINVYFDLEELGYVLALEQLFRVKDEPLGGFSDTESRGVSCDRLKEILMTYRETGGTTEPDDTGYPTKKQCLVNNIRDRVDWVEGKKKQQSDWPMVLVLVRRREFAMSLVDWLQDCDVIKRLDLKVARLVGHGAGRSDGGMSVKRQEKILSQIREHRYDVIVATSVAEEGLDIPECELVIQLDPPTTVTTLVQVRGRARKRGSHYILVCRSHDQAEDLRDLMKREEHMVQAVHDRIEEQKQRGSF